MNVSFYVAVNWCKFSCVFLGVYETMYVTMSFWKCVVCSGMHTCVLGMYMNADTHDLVRAHIMSCVCICE